MSIILAESPEEILSGRNSNVAVDIDGVARLASRNILPDPGLYRSNVAGNRHPNWSLGHAPRPDGWAAYMRDFNELKIISRQNDGLNIDLSQAVFEKEDALVNGPSFSKYNEAVGIPRPDEPRAATYTMPQVGFPEGWYVMAHAYTNDENVGSTDSITEISPKSEPFFLTQGEVVRIQLDIEEVPPEVRGIIIYMSLATDNQNIVLDQPMYEQQRITRRNFKSVYRINGPYNQHRLAKEQLNDTRIGVQNLGYRLTRRKSQYNTRMFEYRLGAKFITRTGISATMDPTNVFSVDNPLIHKKLSFHPRSWPTQAIGWIPQILAVNREDINESQWYDIEYTGGKMFKRGDWADIYTEVPSEWPDKHTKLTSSNRLFLSDDKSGIAGPDSPIASVEVINPANTSGLTPGKHAIRHSLWSGDEEGPVSAPTTVDVATGEAIRTFRPLFHNKMDNEQLQEFDNTNAPRGWVLHRPLGTATSVQPGEIRHRDETLNTTNQEVWESPAAYLSPNEDKFILRFGVQVDLYASGKVAYYLEEYDGSDVLLKSTLITSAWTEQDAIVVRRLHRTAAESSPYKENLDPNTSYVRLKMSSFGTGAAGGLNLRAITRHIGVFESWSTPKKRNRVDFFKSDGIEDSTFVYPHGGYCKIIENPPDRAQFYADRGILRRENYETDLGSGATVTDSDSTLDGFVGRSGNAAFYGDFGLISYVTGAKSVALDRYVNYPIPEKPTRTALKAKIELYRLQQAGSLTLLSIRGNTGREVARLRLAAGATSGSRLFLQSIEPGATNPITSVGLADGVDDQDHFTIEIHVNGVGTIDGTARAYIGRGPFNMQQVATLTGLDLSSEASIDNAHIGVSDESEPTDTWRFHFDQFTISEQPTDVAGDVPGNQFEYYGPAGTPKRVEYGPHGMQVPVIGGKTYTLQARVKWEDVATDSQLFRTFFRNANGNILQNNGPLVTMNGDSDGWFLRTVTLTAPNNATYLDFFGNLLGAGTVKVMGVQLEETLVGKNLLTENQSSAEDNNLIGIRTFGGASPSTSITTDAIQSLYSFRLEAGASGSFILDTQPDQVPVSPGETIAAQFTCNSSSNGSSFAEIAFRDSAGNIIGSAKGGSAAFNGTNQLRAVTAVAPTGTVSADVRCQSDGLLTGDIVDYDKLQIEVSDTITRWEMGSEGVAGSATRYIETIPATGFFDLTLDLGIPGIDTWEDPMEYLDSVRKIEDTAILDNAFEGSSVSMQFASLSDPNDTPNYTTNKADLDPRKQYLKFRVDMDSNLDQTVSPEVTGVGAYVSRHEPILCKPDGTDFYGGCLVTNVPAVDPQHNIETSETTTGAPRFKTWSPQPNEWLNDLTIQVFRDEARTEMRGLVGEDESVFILEAGGKRYRLLILEMSFSVQPQTRHTMDNGDVFVIHEATGVNAFVLSQETIDG